MPSPKEIHVYHHNIKKGDTIYISGMNRTKPKKMLVVSVTKKGEAQELGVEEAA